MYDSWTIVVGVVVGAWGVWGLLMGKTTLYFTNRRRWRSSLMSGEYVPNYTYNGRGLAAVMTITGAVLAGLYVFSHEPDVRISLTTANTAGAITCVIGALLSLLLMLTSGSSGNGASDPSLKSTPSMSLKDAANYLKMPEDKLLEMAQNGGIEARHVQGVYHFDKEILDAYLEAMGSLR